MKSIIGLAVILVFLSSSSKTPYEPVQAKIIIFENSQGKVTLKHMDHSEEKGVKCFACHHKYIRAKPAACSRCHPRTTVQKNEKFSDILMKDAMHKCCLDCHKMMLESPSEKPPVKCEDCHQSESSTASIPK